MSFQAIESYFESKLHKPFYMVVNDADYNHIKNRLSESGVGFIRVSDCCRLTDKRPDIDKLREGLRTADVDCDSNHVVVLGLGEYLALEGTEKALEVLNEFKDFNLGSAQAVFLLRGVKSQIETLVKTDPRLDGRQIYISSDCSTELRFMLSTMELGMYEMTGLKNILKSIEDGESGQVCANTAFLFPNSVFGIQIIKNSYEAVKKQVPEIKISENFGTEEFWDELLKDLNQCCFIDKVFEKYNFDVYNEYDFYQNVCGTTYSSWIYFLFLILNKDHLTNQYLKYVVENSCNLENFKYNILNAIIDISHDDTLFDLYYLERKKLVCHYPEADIATFVSNNRLDQDESIYKLTDNTNVEREEIIATISKQGVPNSLRTIYPALYFYLKKYNFQGDSLNNLLTEYFEEYKKQKVKNTLLPDFLSKVDELAINREYNRLRTRDELIENIDKDQTFLCWVDALGVEYLSFIHEMASKRGLAISVKVGRSDLPTITEINRGFYDNWPNSMKCKIQELDDTKHKEKGGYKYGPDNLYPIHLAKELNVITKVIEDAATSLASHKYNQYVISSDHGASRLAVLRKKEEKYETDTRGEHSGRCCKKFDNYDLPFATEENGYIVLADYGRFKGSRTANVEVHGGASLEEVVVPVIVLSLKDTSVTLKVVEQTIKADYKTGITFTLFVNKTISQTVSVEYDSHRYAANKIDEYHYAVEIVTIKRAGTYKADVYLDDDLVSQISVKAVGKSASVNNDFDDLF